MSSYQCSDKHIATIAVAYAIQQGLPMEEAQLLADKLKADNIAGVNYRYDKQTLFSPCSIEKRALVSDKELVGLCNCLEYQSCDLPNYDNTLLRAIRAKLAGDMPQAEIETAWTTMD